MTFNNELLSMNFVTKNFHPNKLIVTNYSLYIMNTFVAKIDICYGETHNLKE